MTEAIIITLLHWLIVTFIHSSYFQLLIHKSNLQSCLCQYVKDLFQGKKQRKKIVHFSPFTFTLNGGEYRGRTDDLLHAMQAL